MKQIQISIPEKFASLRRSRCVVAVTPLIVVLLGVFMAPAWSQDQERGYVGPEYRIGPEDELEISVWREDELQRTVLVRPDGGISFPLAGSMPAAGKTTREIEADITERLQKYIPEAVVTVSVQNVSGYRIFIIGQVKKPGQYIVGRYVDVVQALTLAGGLSPYASEDDIKIFRRKGEEVEVIPFDFSRAESGRDMSQNVMLESGDTIVVP